MRHARLRCRLPGCSPSSRLSRECQSAAGSAPIATITSPTCSRHSCDDGRQAAPPGCRDTTRDLDAILVLASCCGSLGAAFPARCQQSTARLAPCVFLVCVLRGQKCTVPLSLIYISYCVRLCETVLGQYQLVSTRVLAHPKSKIRDRVTRLTSEPWSRPSHQAKRRERLSKRPPHWLRRLLRQRLRPSRAWAHAVFQRPLCPPSHVAR